MYEIAQQIVICDTILMLEQSTSCRHVMFTIFSSTWVPVLLPFSPPFVYHCIITMMCLMCPSILYHSFLYLSFHIGDLDDMFSVCAICYVKVHVKMQNNNVSMLNCKRILRKCFWCTSMKRCMFHKPQERPLEIKTRHNARSNTHANKVREREGDGGEREMEWEEETDKR